MKNKELLRRIDERNYLTEREHREFIERLSKDLEELEKYRKVMCNPILDIMKDLEILEIFKKAITKEAYLEWFKLSNLYGDITDEELKKIEEWLDGKD